MSLVLFAPGHTSPAPSRMAGRTHSRSHASRYVKEHLSAIALAMAEPPAPGGSALRMFSHNQPIITQSFTPVKPMLKIYYPKGMKSSSLGL